MTVRTRFFGWLVLALTFALWPPLIAASIAFMPQPLATLSAICHGASFIFVGMLGIYLVLPDRRPIDSLLPPLPDHPDLFRHARCSGEEGEIISQSSSHGKGTGGSEWGSVPSSAASTTGAAHEDIEELKEGKSGERGG